MTILPLEALDVMCCCRDNRTLSQAIDVLDCCLYRLDFTPLQLCRRFSYALFMCYNELGQDSFVIGIINFL